MNTQELIDRLCHWTQAQRDAALPVEVTLTVHTVVDIWPAAAYSALVMIGQAGCVEDDEEIAHALRSFCRLRDLGEVDDAGWLNEVHAVIDYLLTLGPQGARFAAAWN